MLPFWKLVGWVIYVALYMYACDGMNQWPEESLRSVGFKILPVLQCLFIVLSSQSQEPGHSSYKQNITLGLVLSIVGDGLLVYEKNRELGGVFFAIAHMFYLRAFGTKPVGGGPTLVSFLVIWISIVYYLFPSLKGSEIALVPGYFLLLNIMAWRATVRYSYSQSLLDLLLCMGAILFVASDIVLLSEWLVAKRPLSAMVVMVTYYLAQLGISLSATDDFTPSVYDITKAKRA